MQEKKAQRKEQQEMQKQDPNPPTPPQPPRSYERSLLSVLTCKTVLLKWLVLKKYLVIADISIFLDCKNKRLTWFKCSRSSVQDGISVLLWPVVFVKSVMVAGSLSLCQKGKPWFHFQETGKHTEVNLANKAGGRGRLQEGMHHLSP